MLLSGSGGVISSTASGRGVTNSGSSLGSGLSSGGGAGVSVSLESMVLPALTGLLHYDAILGLSVLMGVRSHYFL